MAIKSETELYAPLKKHFENQGYQVKGEVRSCDLVGVREPGEPPLIVEMKKSFNLPLLLQGVERLKLSPVVYLAVERCREKKGSASQRWGELTELCRRLGLGLVTVVFYKTKAPLVEVLAEPEEPASPARRRSGRRQERLLYEFRERSGDYNTGGSTRVKLVTAYREKALRVAAALEAAEREAALAAAAAGEAAAARQSGGRSPASATGRARAAAPAAVLAGIPGTGAGRAGAAAKPAPEGVTPAELRRRSGVPAAAAILQANYYGWFSRVARGRYCLTAAGQAALLQYAAVSVSQSLADRERDGES
ncbi:hypothetical protein KIH86_07200 [Paenibacillus sp. HN-1]|uniref:DUF2161 family putative PD-(D/E)XK-type phosphodiesterase n=1 Tax=Paenibacillus TaxID=44249 RepID=UPI001CA98A3F|nr:MULTISPECIES: DUF2161 family putative PD-(D/E)XK-type phosphodiesterase [Paenibacillus]MBY9080445.1 hypothetical protein [Paenibacillus sp. CGMCC 1.18879]MBY9084025.1 hypothetical protein [Paenibacillus sinensis]